MNRFNRAGRVAKEVEHLLLLQDGDTLHMLYAPDEHWFPRDLTLSEDGRWLAVLLSQTTKEPEAFLLFDLQNWTIERVSLQPVKTADAAIFAPGG